jgi:hypothetical protein
MCLHIISYLGKQLSLSFFLIGPWPFLWNQIAIWQSLIFVILSFPLSQKSSQRGIGGCRSSSDIWIGDDCLADRRRKFVWIWSLNSVPENVIIIWSKCANCNTLFANSVYLRYILRRLRMIHRCFWLANSEQNPFFVYRGFKNWFLSRGNCEGHDHSHSAQLHLWLWMNSQKQFRSALEVMDLFSSALSWLCFLRDLAILICIEILIEMNFRFRFVLSISWISPFLTHRHNLPDSSFITSSSVFLFLLFNSHQTRADEFLSIRSVWV